MEKKIYGENYLKEVGLWTMPPLPESIVLLDRKDWEEACKILNALEQIDSERKEIESEIQQVRDIFTNWQLKHKMRQDKPDLEGGEINICINDFESAEIVRSKLNDVFGNESHFDKPLIESYRDFCKELEKDRNESLKNWFQKFERIELKPLGE